MTNFHIVDIPGRGLNFQSASLPAFTNGAGVTFDVRYRIEGNTTWRTFATDVDASRPFEFSLPQPGNLYYTHIGFFFGDVPAGFALGNEIRVNFIVGHGAPNNVLVNTFLVNYDNVEREGSGTAIIVPEYPTTGENDSDDSTPGTPPTITTQPPTQPSEESFADEAVPLAPLPTYTEQETYDPQTAEEERPGLRLRRRNPQTGDELSTFGIIVSFAGLIVTLGIVLLLLSKRTKKKTEIKTK